LINYLNIIHVLRTIRVNRTIPQHTARQPAKSPNSETQNSSFLCTAVLRAQQLSLHRQPKQTGPKAVWLGLNLAFSFKLINHKNKLKAKVKSTYLSVFMVYKLKSKSHK
jgi:hypothetical protein